MNKFEPEWEQWAAMCVHAGITPQSRESLQVVFYSGAMAWARLVTRIASEHGPADAHAVLTALLEEMIGFANARRGPKEYEQ